MCRSGHAWRLHAHGKEWERSLWGANGGMSGRGSEGSGFGGGMNGEGSKRSGFDGYEKQV